MLGCLVASFWVASPPLPAPPPCHSLTFTKFSFQITHSSVLRLDQPDIMLDAARASEKTKLQEVVGPGECGPKYSYHDYYFPWRFTRLRSLRVEDIRNESAKSRGVKRSIESRAVGGSGRTSGRVGAGLLAKELRGPQRKPSVAPKASVRGPSFRHYLRRFTHLQP